MTARKPKRAAGLGGTDAEYARLLEAQGGHCALCPATPKTRRLNVDHDHRTGVVRGLLCHRCNRALPNWVTPRWLDNAWCYLNQTAESMADARLKTAVAAGTHAMVTRQLTPAEVVRFRAESDANG